VDKTRDAKEKVSSKVKETTSDLADKAESEARSMKTKAKKA